MTNKEEMIKATEALNTIRHICENNERCITCPYGVKESHAVICYIMKALSENWSSDKHSIKILRAYEEEI